MRILELINTLEQGGAEQMASTLAIALRSKGHQVHLACLRDLGFMPVPLERLEASGVTLAAFNKADGFSLTTLRELSAYIRRNRIEVVHSHNPLASHYGALAAALGGARAAVNTVHGTATLRMNTFARTLFWLSCFANDRMVSVCNQVETRMRSLFRAPGRKYTTIYNGIELDSLLGVRPRRQDGTIVFGTMARLVAVKDHQSLLRGFASIRLRYPHCRLEILGDGELRSDLERLAGTLCLGDTVFFRGWNSDIASFLSQIDIFVLSSLSEGLPLSVLEGMAAALPVVATSVGGVTEIVDAAGCGWLCRPGDPNALAESLEIALLASDRMERGAFGRQAVIERYSLQAMTDQYEALFTRLLGNALSANPNKDFSDCVQNVRARENRL
jgi:glycosyltransferase involved in cell wall biosynthesis